MITIEQIREKLDNCKNPLIFYDDDADGVCSFLLIYKYLDKGNGVIIKSSPEIKADKYLPKIKEYNPDLVIILDKPLAEKEFLEGIKCDAIWLDHHAPVNPTQENIFYYNPVNLNEFEPTSGICWKIVKDKNPKDVWIALTGITGDWHYDENTKKEFLKLFPKFIDSKLDKAPDILFNSQIGKLVKVITFNLKGKLSDVKTSLKILTRIEHPDEILLEKSPAGKLIYKKFKQIEVFYDKIKTKTIESANDTAFLIAINPQPKYSFSSELSNEILYLFPKKIVIVGRTSSGETKCSIRTSLEIDLRPIVENAASGIGYGGGHKQACGACVKEESTEIFLEKLKEGINKVIDKKTE
jgi:single-stranded DNA-specific DHH superfamily exonuclease